MVTRMGGWCLKGVRGGYGGGCGKPLDMNGRRYEVGLSFYLGMEEGKF